MADITTAPSPSEHRWGSIEISPRVDALIRELHGEYAAVSEHPLPAAVATEDAVRTFMEHHVFAVWDFMSLLTALQASLTCVQVPWRPVGSAEARRFVNELVVEEESDVHPSGSGFTSHFELYLQAMAEAGASTEPVRSFLGRLDDGASVPDALDDPRLPPAARSFVNTTWTIVSSNNRAQLIGAFAFGRESLIPAMFTSLRAGIGDIPGAKLFGAYLDRHIDLDGNEHTPLAFRLVDEIVGEDPAAWSDVRLAAASTLRARAQLWDGVHGALLQGAGRAGSHRPSHSTAGRTELDVGD